MHGAAMHIHPCSWPSCMCLMCQAWRRQSTLADLHPRQVPHCAHPTASIYRLRGSYVGIAAHAPASTASDQAVNAMRLGTTAGGAPLAPRRSLDWPACAQCVTAYIASGQMGQATLTTDALRPHASPPLVPNNYNTSSSSSSSSISMAAPKAKLWHSTECLLMATGELRQAPLPCHAGCGTVGTAAT